MPARTFQVGVQRFHHNNGPWWSVPPFIQLPYGFNTAAGPRILDGRLHMEQRELHGLLQLQLLKIFVRTWVPLLDYLPLLLLPLLLYLLPLDMPQIVFTGWIPIELSPYRRTAFTGRPGITLAWGCCWAGYHYNYFPKRCPAGYDSEPLPRLVWLIIPRLVRVALLQNFLHD